MAKVKDPVCGMEFDESQAEAQKTYNGQAYYFLSRGMPQDVRGEPRGVRWQGRNRRG